MNVQGAWSQGVTGRGVVVTILDDGLEKDHPDLMDNYVSNLGMSSGGLTEGPSLVQRAAGGADA